MVKGRAIEIKENIWWVGVKDWERKLFDALLPLSQGTTYNAYLVKGEKIALIDTVRQGYELELETKINEAAYIPDLDYLIMNHAEPDHAGAIPFIMKQNKKIKLIATEKGREMAKIYYGVDNDRVIIVKDNDTIELGGKTLRFIEAPWLHWPETMFTYVLEDGALFPCDFFGAHTARGFYDDENEEIIGFAKKYFGEIMMPFRNMGDKAVNKLENLKINIIAPSHGPIYRNPARIIDAYKNWVKGKTQDKVVVVYVSMWGATEIMIKKIIDALNSCGVETVLHNLANLDIGEIAKDFVDSRGIVLGTPAILGGMHPLGIYAATLVKALRPPLKYAVVLSSYGWGGGVVKQVKNILTGSAIEIVDAVEINGPPQEDTLNKIEEIGRVLAEKVKMK